MATMLTNAKDAAYAAVGLNLIFIDEVNAKLSETFAGPRARIEDQLDIAREHGATAREDVSKRVDELSEQLSPVTDQFNEIVEQLSPITDRVTEQWAPITDRLSGLFADDDKADEVEEKAPAKKAAARKPAAKKTAAKKTTAQKATPRKTTAKK